MAKLPARKAASGSRSTRPPAKSSKPARPAAHAATNAVPHKAVAPAGKPKGKAAKRAGSVVVEPPPKPHVSVYQLLAKGAIIPKTWKTSRSYTEAKLTRSDLEHFLRELLRKRAEILGDVNSMEDEALRRMGSGDLSNMPIHMAELGSDNFEQEFTLNLLEHEQKMLAEIDEAIVRMSEGDFGVCQATGKPIGRPRLEAKPWAKYCIEYVREQERKGLL